MRKPLTALDIKILQALWEIGPRNLSKIARVVGIPRDTLEFRIQRMRSNPQIFLRTHTSVYHTKIGLRKAVVFMEAKPGMEQLLFDCLKANEFWLYICRSYGSVEGCTAAYAIPREHTNEFEEYLHEMKRLDVAEDPKIYWSTCFQAGRITSKWFDSQGENWVFRWNDWMREVKTQKTDLPYTLMEPKSYPVCADEIDVQMLMKLEANATKSVKEIAEDLGISRQLAHFHYRKHLLDRKLIEGYEVFAMRYGNTPAVMVYFIVTFHDYATFAKFARSLLDKFFVITMGKVLGENGLIMEVFLPLDEFRKFVDALSALARMKLVRSYKYAIQDLMMRSRQTFSGEFFRNDSWIYDHKKYMNSLRRKVATSIYQVT